MYTGMARSYCTITKSNLSEITVGTKEFALAPARHSKPPTPNLRCRARLSFPPPGHRIA